MSLNLVSAFWSSTLIESFDKAWDFLCRSDKILPLIIGILCAAGVAGIYSSGTFRGSDEWIKQLLYIGIGIIAYIVIAAIPYKYYKDWSYWLYAAGTAMLVPIALCALINKDLGNFIHEVNGSRRWYFLGSTGIQPSEFAKITTTILIAKILAYSPLGRFRDSWRQVLKVALFAGAPWLLIVVEPDLGSSIVYIPMTLALLFLAGLSKKFFFTLSFVGIILGSIVSVDLYFYRERVVNYYHEQGERPRDPARDIRGTYQEVSWFPLKDYQRERLLSFIDPNAIDPKGIGSSWNVRQSLISVGKGGITGTGFNKGMQAKLGYLPELAAHNDFLFSVIAEEYGFIGCASLVLLYLLMLLRALQIAFHARDTFASLLAVGIAVILMIHVLINIGMNIGLMPVTGLSLPFMSYGGSFVLSCFILLGLLQSIHSHSQKRKEQEPPTSRRTNTTAQFNGTLA